MCCYTGPVEVKGTSIFVRPAGDKQVVIYQTTFASPEPVAMVLPVPVAGGDLEFIDLSEYRFLFYALEAGFEEPTNSAGFLDGDSGEALAVVRVGDYIASFAPSLADLDRLDPRFRLPLSTWKKLPDAEEMGFAVFQLDVPHEGALHPMAFRYKSARPDHLVFPTLHLHDGAVHDVADFDHSLYFQGRVRATKYNVEGMRRSLEEAFHPADYPRVDNKIVAGLISMSVPVLRIRVKGQHENADIALPRVPR